MNKQDDLCSNVTEVFAEYIVGDNVHDMNILLAIVNSRVVSSAQVWSEHGLKVNGRMRKFKTKILIDFELQEQSPLSPLLSCVQSAMPLCVRLESSGNNASDIVV